MIDLVMTEPAALLQLHCQGLRVAELCAEAREFLIAHRRDEVQLAQRIQKDVQRGNRHGRLEGGRRSSLSSPACILIQGVLHSQSGWYRGCCARRVMSAADAAVDHAEPPDPATSEAVRYDAGKTTRS